MKRLTTATVALALTQIIAQQAALAQTIQDTVVDQELLNIPSASSFLQARRGLENADVRERVLTTFCRQGIGYGADVMVLSSRITEQEASSCEPARNGVAEVFKRNGGYVYFNLDSSPDVVLDQYLIWTDPSLDIDADALLRFLQNDNRRLPGVLETSTPETCVSNNQLACADGTYCCKGTCIDLEEECE